MAIESVSAPGPTRRAEVLAALSLAIDLGLGQPMEHMLRSSLLATSLARRLGLDEHQRAVVYYATLMTWIGCHADSHELAHWFGDDIAFRADSYAVDWRGRPFLGLLATHVARDQPPLVRATRSAALFAGLRGHLRELIRSHCSSAGVLADRVGVGDDVGRALAFVFERWDGGGLPTGARAEAIPIETRVVQIAEVGEVHLRQGGVAAAIEVARSRAGRQFDPAIADVFCAHAAELADELATDDVWDAALRRAPDRDVVVADDELDDLLAALGAFADLKCPYLIGHSTAVSELAGRAAHHYGLPNDQIQVVRRAGLVHDLGRMGVSNGVWEKTAPLSEADRERIRLYPYLTARVLSRIGGLTDVAAVAGAHHERLDGSGYPRGLTAASLSPAQRLLAAADRYQSMLEYRPYRPAMTATATAAALREQARAATLEAHAVEAVLEAAGTAVPRRGVWPAGLTGREVEVLRLLAGGRPNAAIAATLTITEKTVRNHIEHIYIKIGVNNRTGASFYALEHGILGGPPAGQR